MGADVVGTDVVGADVVGTPVVGTAVVGAAVGSVNVVANSVPSNIVMSASSAQWPVHQFESDNMKARAVTPSYSFGKVMVFSFHEDSPTFLERAV